MTDPSDTPKTDAAAFKQYDSFLCASVEYVLADFARVQERRIAELEKQLRDSKSRERPWDLEGIQRYRD